MNKEQRKASSVDVLAGGDKKTGKDHSKHFGHAYQPPDLKEAKERGKQEVRYNKDFQIDERYRGAGNERTFLIKTHECQANAYDTEVITGILEALGYQATADINTADVILINIYVIEENAESKVFNEIGNLKHLKKERPDTLIGVCGRMS